MIVPDRRMSWFRLLFEVRGSTIPRIRGRLFAVFVVAWAATLIFEIGGYRNDLTTTPFTLIGFALGVFLGFRNNASYDRYWEGRRLWGKLVNDARSFTRLTLALIADDATPHAGQDADGVRRLQRELVYGMIAYVHALRMHLRNSSNYDTELGALLQASELAALSTEHNVPILLLQRLSEKLQAARREGWLRELDVQLFENTLTSLTDVQGGCERIKATPIPWSYTVLIHSIVATYCFALPFGLVATTEWLTPIVTVLIAYAFLGLDAVGDEIEEPFGLDYNDLPLATLSRMIEVNLRQRLGETELPPLLEPDACRVLS
jgi:putative membrane protein